MFTRSSAAGLRDEGMASERPIHNSAAECRCHVFIRISKEDTYLRRALRAPTRAPIAAPTGAPINPPGRKHAMPPVRSRVMHRIVSSIAPEIAPPAACLNMTEATDDG